MKTELTMPDERDGMRCYALRCKSKRGERLYPEEQAFCERIFEDFPEWYARQSSGIFEDTKPPGATVTLTQE